MGRLYLLVYLGLIGLLLLLFWQKTIPALVFPVYFVVLLLLITTFNRTLPVRWVGFAFLYGATIVAFLVIVIGGPVRRVLGANNVLSYAVFVPLLEETFKLLPLVFLLIWPRWRHRWTVGATDLLLLGAAIGSGFQFYEDTLRGFLSGWDFKSILNIYDQGPHLGPLYLFPNLGFAVGGGRVEHIPAAFIGHNGAAAFIALTIGWARLFGRRFKPLWLVPFAVWAWMVVDHGLYNYMNDLKRWDGPLGLLYLLDGYGRLTTFVLYLAILGTLVVERWLLRRYVRRTAPFALSLDKLKLTKGGLSGVQEWLRHLQGLRVYLRERRGLTYGLHQHHAEGAKANAQRREHLHERGLALIVWKQALEVGT